jgi:hypothetical protein
VSSSGSVQSGGNATVNTGSGGGGGASYSQTGGGGGNGATGIVVISYLNTYPLASSTTGSPTFTSTGGRYVYVWTGSGSITWPAFGAVHSHATTGALTGQGSISAGTATLSVYPAPADVLAGVVYGPGGIYTGTLTLTAGESIIGLRSFTGRF